MIIPFLTHYCVPEKAKQDYHLLATELVNEKIDLSIWQEKKETSSSYTINKKVLKDYYQQIKKIKKSLGIKWNLWTIAPFQSNSTDIIPTLLKMPDVIQKGEEGLDIVEWEEIEKSIYNTIQDLVEFRQAEGEQLAKDILQRINNITF